jgi:hypothetical protein
MAAPSKFQSPKKNLKSCQHYLCQPLTSYNHPKEFEILSTLFMHFLIDHAPIGVAMLKNINNKERCLNPLTSLKIHRTESTQ